MKLVVKKEKRESGRGTVSAGVRLSVARVCTHARSHRRLPGGEVLLFSRQSLSRCGLN